MFGSRVKAGGGNGRFYTHVVFARAWKMPTQQRFSGNKKALLMQSLFIAILHLAAARAICAKPRMIIVRSY